MITRIQRFIQTNIITRIVRVPVVRTIWRTCTIFVRDEFILSPQEKPEGLVQDHSFNLIENLHHQLSRLEEDLGLPLDEAETCTVFLDKTKQDKSLNKEIHSSLIPEHSQSVKNSQCPGEATRFQGVFYAIDHILQGN